MEESFVDADAAGLRLVKQKGENTPNVWWFYYDTSGRLWLAVDGNGDYDEETAELDNVSVGFAAEYRYDGGRQRYMWRLRNPNGTPAFEVVDSGQWRDYLGDSIHRDYTVTPSTGTVSDTASYLAGVGFDDGGYDMPKYVNSDQIGTMRRIADSNDCDTTCAPVVTNRRIFTSFGESVDSFGSSHRYGYAGAHGYEQAGTGDPLSALGWLHVGERYYAPELGRFVQRDPIGIEGGTNVYEYSISNPVTQIDPDGDDPFEDINAGIDAAGTHGGWIGGIVATGGVYQAVPADQAWLEKAINEAEKAAMLLGGVAGIAHGFKSGFLRFGKGYLHKGATRKFFRFAFGGKKSWIHGHIHRRNWWKPWKWFQKLGKRKWYCQVRDSTQPKDPHRFGNVLVKRDGLKIQTNV